MEENGKMLTNYVQIFHTDKNGPDEKYRTERITCRGIVVNEGKILISHETVGDLFLIPGGGLEPGETPEECCKREVMEETGYIIEPVNHFADVYMYYGSDTKYINHFYACEIKSHREPQLLDYEIELGLRPDWCDIEEIYEIYSNYKKYKLSEPERYVLYQREFLALDCYLKLR